MIRTAIVLLCMAFMCTAVVAQPVFVDVRLTQPPPNQLKVADLWKIELNNRARRTVRIFLRGTAEELSVPDGIIADAHSAEFDVPPGPFRITAAGISPIDVDDSNPRYRDALLSTGNVPTGEYQICVYAIDAETQQVVGQDCKFVTVNRMSVPILISPPDESEVPDRYPVFTWMASVPPGPGQIIKYELKIAEIFGTQTPADAIARNPAWFQQRNLTRTILNYPVSSRSFVKGQRYAWMVAAYEERGTVVVPLGESEIWWFTWNPIDIDDSESQRDQATRPTPVTPQGECPGDNWDFEIGTLACWEVQGESYADDPVVDAHPIFGNVGQQGKYWVTSYGPVNADEAMGTMLSNDFKIQNSTISFLFGGVPDEMCRIELLLERIESDTFSFQKRSLPGTSAVWHIARATGMRDAASSDRFVPIEWEVLQFLNRNARILIIDSSKVGHVNADDFRFFDKEKLDTVKYPVLVMAAGENHSLVATPEEKPKPKLQADLAANVVGAKSGQYKVDNVNVVNNTSPLFKANMESALQTMNIAGGNTQQEPQMPDVQQVKMSPSMQATLNLSALAALQPQNQVWGWGDNIDRAVGPGLGSVVKEPKQIKDVKHVLALEAGLWCSFGVEKDGTLKVWGSNEHAQLGMGDRTARGTPTANTGISKVSKVASGAFHTLATTSTGQLYVWGWNRMHGCGGSQDVYTNNTTGQVDSTVFFKIPIPHVLLKNIVDVAAGEGHSLVLTATGTVIAWGINNRGQTGRPMDEEVTDTPKSLKIGDGSRYVRAVSAGFDHSMALGVDGRVWTWGGNGSGQLGDGTTTDRFAAKAVTGLKGIRAIAAGDGFSLALDSSGIVYAWGNNVLGQLGDGTRIGKTTPVQVSRIDAVQGIVAGGAHAMAVRADGSLWTWGHNGTGQLGEGPVINLVPVPLDPPIGPFRVERLATK